MKRASPDPRRRRSSSSPSLPRRALTAVAGSLLAWGASGCIEVDDSPSMQAELRAARAELVEATREIREATRELEAATAAASRAGGSRSGAQLEARHRLRRIDDVECARAFRCELPRALVLEAVSNSTKLAAQATVRRVEDKVGKKAPVVGYKLGGVRGGSLPEALGLRSGDVIERLQGKPLDTPKRYQELMPQLRKAKKISATVRRGKKRHNLELLVKG